MTGRLQGIRVIVTRAEEGSRGWAEALADVGASVRNVPVIAPAPPASWDETDQAIDRLSAFDLAVFTSGNGVRFFFGRLAERAIAFPSIQTAAVGRKTADLLRERGVVAKIVPSEEGGAEELGSELKRKHSLKGLRVLFPKAEAAREWLPEFLIKEGALLTSPTVYRTLVNPQSRPEVAELIAGQGEGWVTFASPSAVRAFAELGGKEAATRWFREKKVKIASIGRTTSDAVRSVGWSVHAEAASPGIEAMIEAIAKGLRKG